MRSRLTRAREEWGTMTLEQKQSFIRLITNNIRLDTLSGRWMKLTIEWSPLLAGENYTEFALFLRTLRATTRWTPEEKAIVREMFPQSPKSDILATLPHRSWVSIKLRATILHLKRPKEKVARTVWDALSLEDCAVINDYGINQEWLEEGCTEYWGIEDTVINSDGVFS